MNATQDLGRMSVGTNLSAISPGSGRLLATKTSDSRWHVRYNGGRRCDLFNMDLATVLGGAAYTTKNG